MNKYILTRCILMSMLLFPSLASALTNSQMHDALTIAAREVGAWEYGHGRYIDWVHGIAADDGSAEIRFIFVTVGQAKASGSWNPDKQTARDVHNQPAMIRNEGNAVVVEMLTRELPMHLHDAFMGSRKTQRAIKDFQEVDDAQTRVQVAAKRLRITTRFSGRAINNAGTLINALEDYFRYLAHFNDVVEDQQNWARHDFAKEVPGLSYASFDKPIAMKLRGVNAKIDGARVFQQLTEDYFSDDWLVGKAHWVYAINSVKAEDRLGPGVLENGVQINVDDTLKGSARNELVQRITAAAKKLTPDNYRFKSAEWVDAEDAYVRVMWVFDLKGGMRGGKIKKYYRRYIENRGELNEKLLASIAELNAGVAAQVRLHLGQFVARVTKFDLAMDEKNKRPGTQGHWEFSMRGINYDIINYGDRMLLSFTLALSDAWTLDEIRQNNIAWFDTLDGTEFLGCDELDIGEYDGDPRQIWVKLYFNYSGRSEQQWQALYKEFFPQSRVLYRSLADAQGANID